MGTPSHPLNPLHFTLRRAVALLIFAALAGAALSPLRAQDGLPLMPAEQCAPVLTHLWTTASNACVNKPAGYACNGGAPAGVEPSAALGASFAPVGALVEASTLDAIDTQPIQVENVSAGIVWLRLQDESNATFLLIGDITLYDVTTPDFPPWTRSLLVTNPAPPSCAAAPISGMVLQTPYGQQANLVINGASVAIIGTALVRTTESETVFSMISGRATVFSQGQRQSALPGQQIRVSYPPGNFSFPISAPSLPELIDPVPLQNLPVALFDRPLLLPQPGYLTTTGTVNLRTAPDVYAALLRELPGGEVLTLLGANPDQTWYHVQLDSGETGWVFAELLVRNIGAISALYTATPLPPQRLGELGTRARVRAADGANLRSGPDLGFRAIARVGSGTLVDLMARSPYSPDWLKVNVGGTVGWMSLLTLDTQAFLEALPIDWNAPLPPTPTPLPGSFGNAFPDPEGETGE
ncbi:MAG: SH3 domain-containing protein [Anaerolineae bacterium]|nr:SH3 domain-containing protein [Anaerolineae bacterium]NUQ04049.1 SH3 domain-containing protein [Anaerolineae bacterium]